MTQIERGEFALFIELKTFCHCGDNVKRLTICGSISSVFTTFVVDSNALVCGITSVLRSIPVILACDGFVCSSPP